MKAIVTILHSTEEEFTLFGIGLGKPKPKTALEKRRAELEYVRQTVKKTAQLPYAR